MTSTGVAETVLAIAGPIASVGLFLSGLDLCREIYERNSTDMVSPMPFIMSLTCAVYWMTYGILRRLPAVIASNSIGTFLEFCYCVYYIIKPGSKCRFATVAIVIMSLSGFTGIALALQTEENVHKIIGLICVILAVFMFASPLDSMAAVIKQRATGAMSFKLSCMTMFAGCIWSAYGIVLADYFVFLPNMIGTCLGILQMTLFLIFPRE